MARRPLWAEVDQAALRDNARWLLARAAPARLCAVVKAFGYGHGPVRAAEAALAGGASWPPGAMADVVAWRLTPTLYTPGGVDAAARAVEGYGGRSALPVHVKVDTGMHRVGADPERAVGVASAVAAHPGLELEGLCTHFAVADEPLDPYTKQQLERFHDVVDR